MSLDFKETKEAQKLFSGLKDISQIKKTAIMINAQKEGLLSMKDEEGSTQDEKKVKAKEFVEKQLRSLTVIDQYCDYIKN